jgi:beta-lactamase class A
MRLTALFVFVAAALVAAQPMASESIADRLAARVRFFDGTVSLYAKNLDTGREVGLDPDRRVRTASTIKLPILCAVESLVAAGTVRWDEPLTVRGADKVSGSGVLPDLGDGTTLSLRNVATLMIIVSDNTATNLVLDRISADAVNDFLDTLGLRDTRVLRKVRGDGAALASPSGWSRAGLVEANRRYGLGVSTPREMVRLLEMLHRGQVVSPAASKDVLGILERQQVKAGIGRHAPGDERVASKSGALDALRSDVGIAYTPGGPVAMAITVDDMPAVDYSPDNAGNRLISDLARLIAADLGRPGLQP